MGVTISNKKLNRALEELKKECNPGPLKGKLQCAADIWNGVPHNDTVGESTKPNYLDQEDVKAAVHWLNQKIGAFGLDVHDTEYIMNMIDEAFQDVMED